VTIHRILQDGAPILREVAHPVQAFDAALATLADDMLETMRETKVGIGLAAPQIGVSTRVIVIELHGNVWTMCNPVIVIATGQQRSVEGCLSVPATLWGRSVARHALISIEYHDLSGEWRQLRARRQMAAVLEHEIDHLNGILFSDHFTGRLTLT